jgi:SnoaL-like polyketide cyclase
MGHTETHQTLHRLFNTRDFDALGQHMRDDVTYEDVPRGLTTKTLDEFKDWLGGWTSAFSDARVDSPAYQEGADFSLARFRGRGRNDGSLGPLPPTNREMDTPFWELFQYDAEGKVVAGAVHYDQVTMLTQLGHLEPPAQG